MADGVPAVRKAAREELRRGATQVKIMASGGVASPSDPIWNLQYSMEELRAIVEEAQAWRTYAMAHAYTPEAISRAVEAGVRSIEHGNLIDRPTAELMARKGAYLVPTLVTYYALDEFGRKLGFPEASQRKVQRRPRRGPRLARDLPRGRACRSASARICSARRTSSRAASSRSARRCSRPPR